MNGLHWEFVLGCATLSPRNHIAVTNAIATCLCSEATFFFEQMKLHSSTAQETRMW